MRLSSSLIWSEILIRGTTIFSKFFSMRSL
jgi:hypothetical protein